MERTELSTIIRQVSANIDAGMPLTTAWGSVTHTGTLPLTEPLKEISTDQHNQKRQIVAHLRPHTTPQTTTQGKPHSIGEIRAQEYVKQNNNQRWAKLEHWWWQRSQDGRRYQRALAMLHVAWNFIDRVGAAPAEILNVAADAIDQDARAAQARATAQAGPQASSRILSTLPLLGMVGAGIVGVNPWDFYLSSLIGALDFGLGTALMGAGWIISRRMVTHAAQAGQYAYDAAFTMTLMQAGIESGASIPATIEAVGRSMRVRELSECARMLKEGLNWWEAWEQVPADFLPVARVMQSAWEQGSSPVVLLRHGAELERRRIQRSVELAHARLGVRLMLPLGLCYLPAFIALGVIPVIAHIATKV